ncbi:unnamed protein product [Symbiodinium necroappetens]|uniref:Uncharacterized protein n=1 Tax=Symbiodinium necroappetens TaxID=1628268 RepID=A0A812SF21_9DINO|nr:unnamed protein product [Symbiodinium necroappetens]
MLLLAAPDAGRPPPEIVGAALKAAGVQATDENLIRALQEAAGARGGNPKKEDLDRARTGAHSYQALPRDMDGQPGSPIAGEKSDRPMPEIKYNTPSTPAITFNNALAQMKKPVQAMRILESMRMGMPDVAMNQRMTGLNGFDPDSFIPPKTPEDVVRTLMQVVPDAGLPPPEIVGAALKAAGIPATEENLERVFGLQLAQDSDVAGVPERHPEEDWVQDRALFRSLLGAVAAEALLQAAPGLGQPPPEVVGLALKQAKVSINEDVVIRALRAAGDKHPNANSIRTALAAAHPGCVTLSEFFDLELTKVLFRLPGSAYSFLGACRPSASFQAAIQEHTTVASGISKLIMTISVLHLPRAFPAAIVWMQKNGIMLSV